MRAITVSDADNSRALLQQEINRHPDARYDHRLHNVSLVAPACRANKPPYSLELNPIERVWKRTRRNCVRKVHFPTLQSLVERGDQQFLSWSEPNEELTRQCRI